MNKIYFLLVLVLLMPINTKAYHEVIDSRCTTSLKLSIKEEAEDVTYRLSKTEEGEVLYNLIFYNLTDNLVLKDTDDNIIKNTRIDRLKPGSKLIINIYASNNNYCAGYKATTKIINVPYYNKFSKSEICQGYENYYLCDENTNINMTEEEFNGKMKIYIASLKNQERKLDLVEEDNEFNLIEFVKKYGVYALGAIAIVGVIIGASAIENKRKNKGIL